MVCYSNRIGGEFFIDKEDKFNYLSMRKWQWKFILRKYIAACCECSVNINNEP